MVTYPLDWKECCLNDVIKIKRGASPRPIDSYLTLSSSGVNWIKIGDAPQNGKYIVSTAEKITKGGANHSVRVYQGDFILSNSMSFGRPYLLGIDGCIHDGWLTLYDFQDEVDKDFLYYLLSSPVVKEQYASFAAGSGVQNLNKEVVKKVQVLLPSLPEQQSIASILSDFDEHIDNLTKLIEKKKAIRDGALEDLVNGKSRLDGFDGEWEEKTLEDICIPNGLVRGPFGGSLKKDMFVRQGNKVYEQRNAIYKSVKIGNYYVADEKYYELSRFAVKANDFIVSCSGTIGKIYRIPKNHPKGIINQALLKITIDVNKCDLDYFYKYFVWDKFQHEIIDNTQGGAMKNLVGMDVFRNSLIRMPKDIAEQQAIASVLTAMDEEIEALEVEKAKMVGIREGAMVDLLTGRVRLKV
ncbi:restriction endonuclease subunit S [Bacillus sp. ISL-45]|uniref:restriction endonuclease subunit S n=1 Tax=Bacillus sp. ISL-45 TaxID=2819128 RepID=UPI001BEA1CE7|nr:restriction endonuclease subunit S [Bacillus sp. ISL-45]MBT2663043.1 restriction endonuclease subunit S [Bacillus sp. ISL-45]